MAEAKNGKRFLFPQYLEEGSTDTAAIIALQAFLWGMFRQRDAQPPLEIDGAYGPVTTLWVKELQKTLGFTDDDIDGKFGPKTREAIRFMRCVDFDGIQVPQT
jgi:peptidoglycan hydrolase-like protein with peptidoglycan-binding domain